MEWISLLNGSRPGQKNIASEISRSAFEQDYDRIIFSHPFRRLQDKTQVHPLPEHDFVHTRLTHSLEVSSVARSLGRKAGEAIVQRHDILHERFTMFDFGAITAAAALAHDLGNPPFGHAGEAALSDFFNETPFGQALQEKVTDAEWKDLTRFEGNAQGFRLLNTYAFGSRLTYATLGAFTKYPCSASITGEKGRKSQKKFGFFQSEKTIFADVALNLNLTPHWEEVWSRHPLAFLVEAADDICYSIIDLEDGCRLGLVSFNETVDFLGAILGDDFKKDKLDKIPSENEKIAVLRAMAIGKLVEQCTEVFLDHEKEILAGDFDIALTERCRSKNILDDISKLSVERIYRSRSVVEIEAAGHEILPGLLEEFIKAGEYLFNSRNTLKAITPRKYQNISLLFPPEIRANILASTSYYEMLRLILDLVSGLTDKHALTLFRRLKGIHV